MSQVIEILLDDKGRLAIPADARKRLGLIPGMRLIVEPGEEGRVQLRIQDTTPNLDKPEPDLNHRDTEDTEKTKITKTGLLELAWLTHRTPELVRVPCPSPPTSWGVRHSNHTKSQRILKTLCALRASVV